MTEITSLRDETRDLLINRPVWLSLRQISKDLNLSEGWFVKFAANKIHNPGVVTIETLNAYLRQKIADGKSV